MLRTEILFFTMEIFLTQQISFELFKMYNLTKFTISEQCHMLLLALKSPNSRIAKAPQVLAD